MRDRIFLKPGGKFEFHNYWDDGKVLTSTWSIVNGKIEINTSPIGRNWNWNWTSEMGEISFAPSYRTIILNIEPNGDLTYYAAIDFGGKTQVVGSGNFFESVEQKYEKE